MRSAKHQPWGPSQTPVPTLGRAGGEGAGLRCVAGDLGGGGALAAPQAALPPCRVGCGGWEGARWAAGPSLPGAIILTRRPRGAPRPAWGTRPAGGAGIPPWRGPLPPPLPGARFLPLPARPPPGRQPTACPRGRQEATCPRKECRAWRAGGGRWAGPGWAGSAPPGRLVRGRERARALPGSPRRPCSRPVRRAGRISGSHTFPAGHAAGMTRGLQEQGVPGGGGRGELGRGFSARPGPPPPPSARPQSPPARRRGQAVTFPHTPPRCRRLWGPGGEQGAD